jgi:hypothetical protein
VKAFQFRLDSVLRWRAAQLQLERESCSRAAGRLAAIQGELTARHSELRSGAAGLVTAGSGAFEPWAVYVLRWHRRTQNLQGQLQQARQALALHTKKTMDAHRKLRIIENLKRDEHARWTRELDRETEAFAGEAFLAGMVRNSRATDRSGPHAKIEKRTGA